MGLEIIYIFVCFVGVFLFSLLLFFFSFFCVFLFSFFFLFLGFCFLVCGIFNFVSNF